MDQINKALLNQLTQKIGVMKGMQMSDEEIEKSFDKSELDLIEKAMGEGSKGGKIIGHTKSGKPIYEEHSMAFKQRGEAIHQKLGEYHKKVLSGVKGKSNEHHNEEEYSKLKKEYDDHAKDYHENFDGAKFHDIEENNKHVKSVNSSHSKLTQIGKLTGKGKHPHPPHWTYNQESSNTM